MANADILIVIASVSVTVAMTLFAAWMARRAALAEKLNKQECALREELEAYARLDPALAPRESPRALAKRVCVAVAKHSAFCQVAMLMQDAENRLSVVGSARVDDQTASAINARVAWFARERRRAGWQDERRQSYPVMLGPVEQLDAYLSPDQRECRLAIILPLWSHAGEMLGALVVWPTVRDVTGKEPQLLPSERELLPLESLAQKLGRSVDIAMMSDRLLRGEKMAGLSHLAKGVAHELNNPLTAVLGFAELIAETASEPRVRADAAAIVSQAIRMKETVNTLGQFWQPTMPLDKSVDVAAMLRGVTKRVKPELARRGVEFSLQLNEERETCNVRGDEEKLVTMVDHLLNNAVQAVTANKDGEARSIRLVLRCDEERLRVVVSDSGAGFADATKVFDPFYTTRKPGDGQGLGLAVSYGIVREHGGEISAFNVYPHGAAVVVELPLARTVKKSAERIGVEA
jgi:signal transduction histidine kinase